MTSLSVTRDMSTLPEPHFVTRVRERYGLELSFQDLKDSEAYCLKAKPLLIQRGLPVYVVIHLGVTMHVIMNPRTGTLITTLPWKSTRKLLQQSFEQVACARRKEGTFSPRHPHSEEFRRNYKKVRRRGGGKRRHGN